MCVLVERAFQNPVSLLQNLKEVPLFVPPCALLYYTQDPIKAHYAGQEREGRRLMPTYSSGEREEGAAIARIDRPAAAADGARDGEIQGGFMISAAAAAPTTANVCVLQSSQDKGEKNLFVL